MTARATVELTRWFPRGVSLAPRNWASFASLVVSAMALVEVVRAGLGAWQAALAPIASWSPGVLVQQLDPHLRGLLLGLAALRCVAWRGRVSENDPAGLGVASWRSACGRATSDLTMVLVLAGYRDLMRGELFATHYGEAQFVGSLRPAEVLGPATFAALVAMTWIIAERWGSLALTADRALQPAEPSSRRHVPRTWIAYAFLLACIVSVRRYVPAAQSGVVGGTHPVLVEAWQCWLAARLILGLEPDPRDTAAWLGWLRRERRPLLLLLTLEVARVVSMGERVWSTVWLPGQSTPVSSTVVSLTGRIHDWIGISVAGAALVVALAALLSGFSRRSGSAAA